jgi:hypothetical protein
MRGISVGISGADVVVKQIQVQLMDEVEVGQAPRFEARKHLPFDPQVVATTLQVPFEKAEELKLVAGSDERTGIPRGLDGPRAASGARGARGRTGGRVAPLARLRPHARAPARPAAAAALGRHGAPARHRRAARQRRPWAEDPNGGRGQVGTVGQNGREEDDAHDSRSP